MRGIAQFQRKGVVFFRMGYHIKPVTAAIMIA